LFRVGIKTKLKNREFVEKLGWQDGWAASFLLPQLFLTLFTLPPHQAHSTPHWTHSSSLSMQPFPNCLICHLFYEALHGNQCNKPFSPLLAIQKEPRR
jgi:hypothetical protein